MQDAAVDVSVYLLADVPIAPSLAVLTPGELRRAEALSTEDNRLGFRAAHTLLRLAVADRLGVPPTQLTIDFACARCGEQHGPPRILAGPGAGMGLSLTRSSGLIAVALLAPEAVGREVRVGIDIDRVDAVGFGGFDEVALSPAESAALAPGDLPARATLWARKEAVAKALGSGLRRDPRQIEVLSADGCGRGEAVVGGRRVTWCDVPLGRAGFAAAAAVCGSAAGTCIRVTLSDAATLF